VCNGILPIDQLREWTGPGELLARRIPKGVLEQLYSFKIYTKEDDIVTGEELLISFACIPLIILVITIVARGYTKAGHQGNPDDARAARILLKDFVNGKIIYCHPPPGISPEDFNRDHYTATPITEKSLNPHAPTLENEMKQVDERFFGGEGPRAMTRNGVFGGRNMQYGFQRSVADDGRVLSRKERKLKEEMNGDGRGKKHFKGRGKK
jgi:large subunit GTPase 1